jgi:hypothetical protein
MDKIIDFIKANKAKIVAVLTAILTFVVSLSEIDMGTKMGVVCSVLIVAIPVIVSFIEGKDMNKTITLLVNAIEVIQEIVRNRTDVAEDFDGNTIVNSKYLRDYSREEIRTAITKGL